MNKEKLKIIGLSKNALVGYYQQNPNDLYAPTHIFPNIDPPPDAHFQEYKQWASTEELYKDHWDTPYMINQFENQDHVHMLKKENSDANEFGKLLNKDVDVEMFHNPDDVKNLGNIISKAKEEYNHVLVFIHRLHSYIVPYHMWKCVHDLDVNICIDNAFEAESYSMHRLIFWLHSLFGKLHFVKYIYAAHDIAYMEHGKLSRKELFRKEFGIDMVNVEFFMLHELQGNKIQPDNSERNNLIYSQFKPELFYKNNKPKKFLCLNNYMKEHRLYIIDFLDRNNLLDKGIVSARFSLDKDKPFYNHGIHDFTSYSQTHGIIGGRFGSQFHREDHDRLKVTLPLVVEDDLIDNKYAVNPDMFTQDDDVTKQFEFRDRWVREEWYADTEFTIATESSFDPDLIAQPGIFTQYIPHHDKQIYYNNDLPNDVGFLTEKTFKPLMYGHPFILVTHAGALERLRRLGFETYPDWFDEEYDDIGDSEKRMKAISRTILKACTQELDINLIKDKLEYNRQHFFSIDNSISIFNNLFDELLKHDKY